MESGEETDYEDAEGEPMEVSQTIDWDNCIICNEKSGKLVSPKNSTKIDGIVVYTNFLANLQEFRKLGRNPSKVNLPDQITPEELFTKNALWHKNCHSKLNNFKLKRFLDKKEKAKDLPAQKHLKRDTTTTHLFPKSCIFCNEKADTLHQILSKNKAEEIKLMAERLQDQEMIIKTGGFDLVAREALYHIICYMKYLRKFKSYQSSESAQEGMTKDKVFDLIIGGINEELENGATEFKISDLRRKYVLLLNENGFNVEEVNSKLFEDKIVHEYKDKICIRSEAKFKFLCFNQEKITSLKNEMQRLQVEEDLYSVLNAATKILRQEILKIDNKSNSNFSFNSQVSSVPVLLRKFVQSLLTGTELLNIEEMSNTLNSVNEQASITISQLIVSNSKQTPGKGGKNTRINNKFETPLPIYLGLKLHNEFKSKKCIKIFHRFGLSISYERVLEILNDISLSICQFYINEKVVVPPSLKKGIFTIGAIDNLDYDTSSTTSQNNFHGTAISLSQTQDNVHQGHSRDNLNFTVSISKPNLPDSYKIVPSENSSKFKLTIPQLPIPCDSQFNLDFEYLNDLSWLQTVSNNLDCPVNEHSRIGWASYHSTRKPSIPSFVSKTAMLPLFEEKTATLSMMKHGLLKIQEAIFYLNPRQVPVVACDQPLYAIAKLLQWKYPNQLGENRLLMFFGGLHLEMSLWAVVGKLLVDSGWTTILSESKVTTSGKADSFLKVAHLTRTRHAHKITSAALFCLQKEEFIKSKATNFEAWKLEMIQVNPTFQFWNIILNLEIEILAFIRSHREKNFDLYVNTLEKLIPWFFSLDRHNYSRWVPIHVRDLRALSGDFLKQIKDNWVISQSRRPFSSIPLDQCHETENAILKGTGGMIGVTENPAAFLRFMTSSPEIAILMCNFEKECFEFHSDCSKHHEDSLPYQSNFQKDVNLVINAIKNYRNPFSPGTSKLVDLLQNYSSDEGKECVKRVEQIGQNQYQTYKNEVVYGSKCINNPIKKNSLIFFRKPNKGKKVGAISKKINTLKNDVNIFSRLFFIAQQRGIALETFFSSEYLKYPPSLSDEGELRSSNKADILQFFEEAIIDGSNISFDNKVYDGAVLLHFISPSTSKSFEDYVCNSFLNYIYNDSATCSRVDLVFDSYIPNSIKQLTRSKRGVGVKLRVVGETKIPLNWRDFLLDSQNKTEICDYIGSVLAKSKSESKKKFYYSEGLCISSLDPRDESLPCNIEEGDCKIILHVQLSIMMGSKSIVIRTVDTDVIILLIGYFADFLKIEPYIEIYVLFGSGNNIRYYSIRKIFNNLGLNIAKVLPLFHALTGCDSTSSFYGQGKKKAWTTWRSYTDLTMGLLEIYNNPFTFPDQNVLKILERFVILLYNKGSSSTSLTDARIKMYKSQKNKDVGKLPPTEDAFKNHVNRVIYQSSIWRMCFVPWQDIPCPSKWGWKKSKSSGWKPLWKSKGEDAELTKRLIQCGCKQGCQTKRCSCNKAGLNCSTLCSCENLCGMKPVNSDDVVEEILNA